MTLLSRILGLKRRFERPLDALNLVEVSRSAVLANFDLVSRLAGGRAVFPVLKSNAYGHGLREVAGILRDRETEYLAVDSAYEALKVRDANPAARVLLLGYSTPGNLAKLDFRHVTPTVHSAEGLAALVSTGRRVRFHVEVDTGMARQGFGEADFAAFLELLKLSPNAELEGMFTHFARADDPADDRVAAQHERFFRMVSAARSAGFSPKWLHAANSPGAAKLPAGSDTTAVRAGLALYGLNPLEGSDASAAAYAGLCPALGWSTTLVEKRILKKGETVSYGGLFEAPEDMPVGAVPVGYYEGIPRSATGKWALSQNGRALPILGRVCMNLCVADLRAAPDLAVGARLTVVSREPGPFDIYSFARACGTIPYEAVTGVAESIRRKVTE